jgi:hypothetical protein
MTSRALGRTPIAIDGCSHSILLGENRKCFSYKGSSGDMRRCISIYPAAMRLRRKRSLPYDSWSTRLTNITPVSATGAPKFAAWRFRTMDLTSSFWLMHMGLNLACNLQLRTCLLIARSPSFAYPEISPWRFLYSTRDPTRAN